MSCYQRHHARCASVYELIEHKLPSCTILDITVKTCCRSYVQMRVYSVGGHIPRWLPSDRPTAHASRPSSVRRSSGLLTTTTYLLVQHEAELLRERRELFLSLSQPAPLPIAVPPLRRPVALLGPGSTQSGPRSSPAKHRHHAAACPLRPVRHLPCTEPLLSSELGLWRAHMKQHSRLRHFVRKAANAVKHSPICQSSSSIHLLLSRGSSSVSSSGLCVPPAPTPPMTPCSHTCRHLSTAKPCEPPGMSSGEVSVISRCHGDDEIPK